MSDSGSGMGAQPHENGSTRPPSARKTGCEGEDPRAKVRCMTVVLDVAADGDQPVLCLRPWLLADMPDLLAATADEYPSQGLGSHPDLSYRFQQRWSGPRHAEEAELWLSGQERGWGHGDWLTFAVTDVSQDKAVGHVGLWNREGGQVGSGGQGEIGYWTAADSPGRGIAPAAALAGTGLGLVHFGF